MITPRTAVGQDGEWRRVWLTADGRYRYRLEHAWPSGLTTCAGYVCWVMLNPSTADESLDDQTMRAVRRFTRREGFAHLVVVNQFAYRSSTPDDLLAVDDPTGPDNARYVADAIGSARVVVCAWGNNLHRLERRGLERVDRSPLVETARASHGRRLRCLGLTAQGAPRHPCRLAGDVPLEVYR